MKVKKEKKSLKLNHDTLLYCRTYVFIMTLVGEEE